MHLAKAALNAAHDTVVFRRRVTVLSSQLARVLPESGTVLDVGCGNGEIAQAIMAIKPGLRLEGIDVFLRPQVAIPAQCYDGVTFPYADQSVDWVTIVDVLHHTDDPALVLREAARVARAGIVIKDHLREGLAARETLRLMDWVGNRGHGVRLPYNYLARAEWTKIFEDVGLRTSSWQEELGLYPFPASAIFERKLHFIATLSLAGQPAHA
ncbi:class I SAM-dependent methyltransferase [Devosia aurantiaca]|uniref:Class I SAM-dependent methyltransferase n=1 Tax=Devosia aurantiaca TaxID=2714858 RepID=A0A6M1SRV0_9HYPH|nr:class I SAM-dependent methyltransferase [Devosia aurantiaca]NGP17113.1 class I SAM-dependent methyltransferase [Devosia aurantiaca]